MPIDRQSMDTLSYFFALMSTKRLRISAKYLQFSPGNSLTGGIAISTYIITPYNGDIVGDLIDEVENNGLYL